MSARSWLALVLRKAAERVDPAATEHDSFALLASACRLFTQGVGEGGYYETMGAVKMARALTYMARAGVEPVWFNGVVEDRADDDDGEPD